LRDLGGITIEDTEDCNSETAEVAEVRRGNQTATSYAPVRLALKAAVSIISVVWIVDSCERVRRV
jgi:hypothetical protein